MVYPWILHHSHALLNRRSLQPLVSGTLPVNQIPFDNRHQVHQLYAQRERVECLKFQTHCHGQNESQAMGWAYCHH